MAQHVEKNGLGGGVFFHRAVIVEMIAGEVGERGAAEIETEDASLVQGVARDFHGAGAAAVVAHFGQELDEINRARRGHGGFAASFAVVGFDGADHAAGDGEFSQKMAEEIGGGGFSVRAGDADRLHFSGGMIVKDMCQGTCDGGGVGDHNLREGASFDLSAADDRDCAAPRHRR